MASNAFSKAADSSDTAMQISSRHRIGNSQKCKSAPFPGTPTQLFDRSAHQTQISRSCLSTTTHSTNTQVVSDVSETESENSRSCSVSLEDSPLNSTTFTAGMAAKKTGARQPFFTSVRHFFQRFTPKRKFITTIEEDNDSDADGSGEMPVEDEYSDDGELNEDDEHDRRQFKAIRNIPSSALEDLVLTAVCCSEDYSLRTCHITHRKEGSFHHCAFFDIKIDGEREDSYVLKIPAHGTARFWKEGDAFALRNEAVLMHHIRHTTACPVPEVIAFDESPNNSIGAPYILMQQIQGMSALALWQGRHLPQSFIPEDGNQHLHADEPPKLLETLRGNFLRSLATAMSQLQSLRFDRIGVPVFENFADKHPISFGPVWRWHSKSTMKALTPIGPFNAANSFFWSGLDSAWPALYTPSNGEYTERENEYRGVRKMLELVLSTTPFLDKNDDEDDPAQFVLRHDDLDLQNIIVDHRGNVLGIIDWEGCMAVPACVGYTSLPTFSRRDWLEEHTMANWPYMTWSYNRYRDIYFEDMKAACGLDNRDAKYTQKSAICQGLLAALHDDECCKEMLGKILMELDDFRRVGFRDFCVRLGKGWPKAEKVLGEKFEELLSPGE